jgi:hypothetical protein
LNEDAGAVLEVKITRENPVYEQRKLWNKGELRTAGWRTPVQPVKLFYVRQTGKRCADYPLNEKVQIHLIDKSTNDWPLATASKLLNLLLWQPVPEVILRQL